MARTAPAPDVPPLPGMCPHVVVKAGGGAGGGGGGGGAGSGGGGSGGGPGGGGSGAGGGGAGAASGSPDGNKYPKAGKEGHPVDPVTGRAYTLPDHELVLPGPIRFDLARSYSSHLVGRDIGFGWSWTHAFGWRVEKRSRHARVWTATGVYVDISDAHPNGPYGWACRRTPDGYELDAGDGLRRVFESEGARDEWLLTRVTDRWDNEITLQYARGALSGAVDSAGRVLQFARDVQGRCVGISIHDARGSFTEQLLWFEYDRAGDLVRVTDAEGYAKSYEYDSGHRLTCEQDRCGLRFNFRYDREGRCVETWGDYGSRPDVSLARSLPPTLSDGTPARGIHHRRFAYYPDHYTEVVESRCVKHFFGNALGTLVKQVRDGAVQTARYDDSGHLLEEGDELGHITVYERDPRGRLLRMIDPLGHATVLERDERGDIVRVVDPTAGEVGYERNARGEIVARTDEAGGRVVYAHNERGQLSSVSFANGATSYLSYDDHGNPAGLLLSDGSRWSWSHDFFGRRTSETMPDGRVTRYFYTKRGDLAAAEQPDGQVWRYEYDGERRPVRALGPHGQAWALVWGGHNRLCERRDPNGARVALRYDREGELVELEDERGGLYQFERDAHGRAVRESTPSGKVTRYRYDAAGRVIWVETNAQHVIEYQYDAVGRLLERRTGAGEVESFAYDAAGRMLRAANPVSTVDLERDAVGRIVSERQTLDEGAHHVRTTYDGAGKVVARDWSNGFAERIDRDGRGARTRTRIDHHEFGQHFDSFGRETLRDLDGGSTVTTTYDPCGLATEHVLAAAGQELRARYFYEAGRPTAHVDHAGERLELTFDPVGYLVHFERPGDERGLSYDAAGNWLIDDACRYAPDGELLATRSGAWTWDPDGRLTEMSSRDGSARVALAWDAFAQLRTVFLPNGQRVEFEYDAIGRRIRKRVVTAEGSLVALTTFFWNGDTLALARDGAAGERFYHYLDDSVVPIAHCDRTPALEGQWTHYVAGPAGEPHMLVDTQGRLIGSLQRTPWGASAGPEAVTTPQRLQGQYYDEETGLVYNRARYFDPAIGRFLSPDPLGLAGGTNRYRYAPNSFWWVDPFGIISHVVEHSGTPVPDVPDVFTINAHGNSKGVRLSGKPGDPQGFVTDEKELANFIRNHPDYKPGMPVRLAACSVGKGSNSIAERLSKEMGVPVEAPTENLFVSPDGSHDIRSDMSPLSKPGRWATFGAK